MTNTSPIPINDDHNRAWSRWKSTAEEWLSVVISCTALLISILALAFAIHAEVRASYQDRIINEQSDSLGVLRIRQAKMDAWLKAHGVPVEEIYDVESTR